MIIPSGEQHHGLAHCEDDVGYVDAKRGLLGWREWVVIVSALIIVIGVAATLSPGFRGFVASGATAAWVQAIGSIGAILAAIGVAHHQAAMSERKVEAQRKHDADTKRAQDQRVLKSIHAELESYLSKRLVTFEHLLGSLTEGKRLPDIPLSSHGFQVYRRSMYQLALLEDSALGQSIHDIYADIETFRMNVALYVQYRLDYIEAYQANEGRYEATSYLAVKAADHALTRQAQEVATQYAALKADLELLLSLLAANISTEVAIQAKALNSGIGIKNENDSQS